MIEIERKHPDRVTTLRRQAGMLTPVLNPLVKNLTLVMLAIPGATTAGQVVEGID